MEEIKFRALNSNNNFVYGLPLFSYGTGEWKITHSNGWIPSYNNPDEGESTIYTNIKFETLGQFTGKKDCKGNDIYDGDIVLLGQNDDFKRLKFIIKNDGFGFYAELIRGGLRHSFWTIQEKEWQIKIIGNIHQNPELLK